MGAVGAGVPPGQEKIFSGVIYRGKLQVHHPCGGRSQFLANVNSCSCSLYVVVRPSVVCLSSVVFVHPTQPIEIFGNVSVPCNTLVT